MSGQHTPEPFGYFKAEPFGWTDCAETDEVAQPLYDQQAIDALVAERDELMAALEQMADNGSILSGGECQRIAYDAITNIKESK